MYPRNMVSRSYRPFYRNGNSTQPYPIYNNDERFFLAPFLVGGLAGTALGYGIANNNQLNPGRPCCGPVYPMPYPAPYFPNTYSTYNTNTFYY